MRQRGMESGLRVFEAQSKRKGWREGIVNCD